MKRLKLSKSGLNKVRAQHKELKQIDIEDSLKSLAPGEWCLIGQAQLKENYLGFVNPLVDEKFSCIQILEVHDGLSSPEDYIQKTLIQAYSKRQKFIGYQKGARLCYGATEGLPGLIVDQFLDKAIIQINTAGIDRYRDFIKQKIELLIKGKAYFLDNAKYREKEFLPVFENEAIPDLEIEEGEIRYYLRSEVIQKIGFYYDHRENRSQLRVILEKLNMKYHRGVDLFCYVGAWGMSALKSQVSHMKFVDQGDFSEEIKVGMEINGFNGRGEFYRSDVFKFLDEALKNSDFFDLILCDPPAFAKSHLQKAQALEGYSKLHRKVLKVALPGALIAFSSCTHYVSHDEFQRNILDAATKENKKLQLLYCGLQGWDHPVSSLLEKSNYIKSYIYLLE